MQTVFLEAVQVQASWGGGKDIDVQGIAGGDWNAMGLLSIKGLDPFKNQEA